MYSMGRSVLVWGGGASAARLPTLGLCVENMYSTVKYAWDVILVHSPLAWLGLSIPKYLLFFRF